MNEATSRVLLLLVAAGLDVGGLGLILHSLRHQNPDDPLRPTFDARKWKPIWLQGSHFRSRKGFSHYVLGMQMIMAGLLIHLVYLGLK